MDKVKCNLCNFMQNKNGKKPHLNQKKGEIAHFAQIAKGIYSTIHI